MPSSARLWTALAVTLAAAACAPFVGELTPTLPPPLAIRVERPITPPDVPMVDQGGCPARLSDFRGKLALVHFTNLKCLPDALCVDGVAQFVRVKRLLGARDDVVYLVIGMDEQADSPVRLKAYLAQADPSFIGLTARREDMRALALRFGIHTYERADGALAPHAPFLYLLDRKGRLVYFFQDGLPAETIAAVVRAEP